MALPISIKNPNRLYYHCKRYEFVRRCYPINEKMINEVGSSNSNIVELLLRDVRKEIITSKMDIEKLFDCILKR